MSIVESLKMLGYIIALAICFLVLKFLSAFEYDQRKNELQKKIVWEENFDKELDSTIWSIRKHLSVDNGLATLEMTNGENGPSIPVLAGHLDLAPDSVFLEIRVDLPNDGLSEPAIYSSSTLGNRKLDYMNASYTTDEEGFSLLTQPLSDFWNSGQRGLPIRFQIKALDMDSTDTRVQKSEMKIDYIKVYKYAPAEMLF